jgi:hypothetical protein
LLKPITLENLEPVGDDEPKTDCVIIYPAETPDESLVVSYDANGVEHERQTIATKDVNQALIDAMLMRLA